MIKKCQGCGIALQSVYEDAPGFIPKDKYLTHNLCARCFKINNYNTFDLISAPKSNQEILKVVNESNATAIFMVDFLNINSETMATYQEITIPKILVISKCDIIPNSIKPAKIIAWLRSTYAVTEEINFLSTKKLQNANFLAKIKKPVIYILGYTNAGKSTYLNHYLSTVTNSHNKITTSMIPNTTIDFISIHLNEKFTIIDSPGFTYQNNFYNSQEINLIKHINPKNFISPITYQVKPNTYVVIEERIVLNSNTKNSFTFYLSNSILLKKVYKTTNYQKFPIKKIHLHPDSDLVIKGVGFINIKSACDLTILTASSDLLEVRESLFRKE